MNTTNGTNDWPSAPPDREAGGDISVGGLAVRLAALERQERSPELAAVGKVIELRRRAMGLPAEELARQAHVTQGALLDLGQGLRLPNTRDLIILVSRVLDLPGERLVAAVGLGGATDPRLRSAILQCATQAKPPERLSPPENAALAGFMEVLGAE
jgi:hypothetical protein